MNETITKVILPITISFLTFFLGIIANQIYNWQKRANDSYEKFYIPLIKIIVVKKILSLDPNVLSVSNLEAIESLISLSFDNLQYMNHPTQILFINFCTLWSSYISNDPASDINSLLGSLKEYLKNVLQGADKNAKRIRKSLPTSVITWMSNYMS